MFTQGIEKLNLYIKEGTPDVPNDRKYYVIKDGRIVGSYRSLERALSLYKEYIPENIKKEEKKFSVEDLKKHDFSSKALLGGQQFVRKKKSGRYHKVK
ncbi:hypothetical protein ES705_01664 [subsurface metagenome]|nr:hypothetical protein [Clostridia bacterium]